MNYDVVIVGAGIAGLYSGMKLSQAGWKTCIVDRRDQIGVPVRCGEATGNRLELSRFVEIDEQWIARDIKGLAVHHNENTPLYMKVKNCGLILHRDRFEKTLAMKAQEYGADILLNANVSGLISKNDEFTGITCEDAEEISGSIIIGADGCESKVGRWAGITREVPLTEAFSSIQYHLKKGFCNNGYIHFFIGSAIIPQGYVWVFPKSDKEVSIGAGVYGARNNSPKVKELLDAFIDKHIPSAEYGTVITGCVPLSVCPTKLATRNVIVIGDAARQANPLTAGGIMNTLEAADCAVKAIVKNNKKNTGRFVHKNYSVVWKKNQRRQQKIFYLLKEIFLDSSDKEIEKAIQRMMLDFDTYIDRSKSFTFPLIPLIQVITIFFPKIIRLLIRLSKKRVRGLT